MGPVTKLLLVLALVVPIGAYVAGSLAATGRDEPADRGPVILRDAPTTPPSETAGPSRNRDGANREGQDDRDDRDDRDGRDGGDDRNDDRDDDARVVKPQPTPVGEDDGDGDGDDDDGPDDDTETERDDDRDDD